MSRGVAADRRQYRNTRHLVDQQPAEDRELLIQHAPNQASKILQGQALRAAVGCASDQVSGNKSPNSPVLSLQDFAEIPRGRRTAPCLKSCSPPFLPQPATLTPWMISLRRWQA